MRKNFGAKPYIYPQPVFIIATYDENNTPNAMNAAWGSMADYNAIAIYLSAGHKTTKNILLNKAFTVSMATEDYVVASDYVGMVSGNKVPDKLTKAGFTTTKSEFVNAPILNELPLAFECEFISFDAESGLLLGKIINVNAEETILDENGLIDSSKLKPIIFDSVHSAYLKIGEKVGNAFKDGNKLK